MLINFNMLDNMDAAAGGVAVICSIALVFYVFVGVTSEGLSYMSQDYCWCSSGHC